MPAPGLADDHRAVMGRHRLDLDGRAVPHHDRLAPHVRLAPLSAELVAVGTATLEAFDEEVLIIGHRVRHAPCHAGVVAEVRQAGHAGEAQADGVPLGAGEMVLVVDVGHVEAPVGIARDERPAARRAGAAERPAVAPLRGLGHERHGRREALHLLEPVNARPAVLGRGRDDQQGMRLRLPRETRRALGAQVAQESARARAWPSTVPCRGA